MKISTLLMAIALLMVMGACQNDASPGSTAQNQKTTRDSAEQLPAGEQLHPSVPLDTLMMLFQQCDYVDYVFYYTNFSVNQSNKGDIQQSLRYISEKPASIRKACKPQGRIFFQVEGENRLEADFYFQPGCTYYVFLEDNQPVYANELTPEGVNFYNNIFSATTK